VISEFCYNFKELIYKQLQTKIAMITEDKVTEIFCMQMTPASFWCNDNKIYAETYRKNIIEVLQY